MVLKVPAHFDGQKVILDAPVPGDWSSGTPLEVHTADMCTTTATEERKDLIEQFFEITKEFFRQTEGQPRAQGRTWKREDAYE